jgi:hypothetical protein
MGSAIATLGNEVAALALELDETTVGCQRLRNQAAELRLQEEAAHRHRIGMDARVAEMQAELSMGREEEATVAKLEAHAADMQAEFAIEREQESSITKLERELEIVALELEESEIGRRRLQDEAAERNKQFLKITYDLEEQIAALKSEVAEEEATVNKAPKELVASLEQSKAPLTTIAAPSASLFHGGGMTVADVAGGTSTPPGPLLDPGRGAEPPPRRGSRQDAGMAAVGRTATGCAPYNGGQTSWTSASQLRVPSPSESWRQPQGYIHNSRATTSARQDSYAMPIKFELQPYWREVDHGWYPTAGVSAHTPRAPTPEANIMNTFAPKPAAQRIQEALEATMVHGSSARGWRPEVEASSNGASWYPGSFDTSLFHTHIGSGNVDSNLLRTPPAGQAQHASPTASTLRRVPSARGQGLDFYTRASSPPRRACTPPPRQSQDMGDAGLAGLTRQASAAASFGDQRAVSPPPFLRQVEAAHSFHGRDRRAAVQASIAELKGVIGATLRSLDEDETIDAQIPAWAVKRAAAFADREEVFRSVPWAPARS